jgi:hypothetical protein
VRSPSNSEGTAGGGPLERGAGSDGEVASASGICLGTGGGDGGFGASRSIRKFNFCWTLSSRICNSEIARSREAILSASISGKGGISGVCIPKTAEEESSARKYTERSESLLGLRKTPMVT